jgi:hypothetical protein
MTNWPKIHAVGGLIPVSCVKYARKGTPDKMTGSLPITVPTQKKKAYMATYSPTPDEPLLEATQKARKRSTPALSTDKTIYASIGASILSHLVGTFQL